MFNCSNKNVFCQIQGNNNSVDVDEKSNINSFSFNITGENNKILIKSSEKAEKRGSINFNITGSNNEIIIENNVAIIDSLTLQILENCNNGKITIGKNTSFWKTFIQTCDNNSSVQIGEDCMFSFDTTIFNTDGHSIFSDGKLINRAKDLIIENHCWIGYKATILKNSHLPKNTIVGFNSLVAGKFTKENTAVAGNPAKVIKEGISWNRNTPNKTMKETENE